MYFGGILGSYCPHLQSYAKPMAMTMVTVSDSTFQRPTALTQTYLIVMRYRDNGVE